jgi:5-formyltetrahydrofolate cyclo-ligase
MNKNELRKQTLANLKKFSENPVAKTMLEQELYQKLFELEDWKSAKSVGLTLSQPLEINTRPIIQRAWAEGKTVAIPRTKIKPIMDFCLYTSETTLIKSDFGLLEPIETAEILPPEKIDFLLIPGIVFHEKGYRIGFGGGFYDAYLKNYSGKTASLAFPFQLNSNWQPENFDKKTNLILTNGELS